MPTELVPGVFDITCLEQDGKRYRVFLFTQGTPTLFDTGLGDTVEAVIDGIEAVGVAPERLVITHGDGDHVGGFGALIDRYDLESWVPQQSTFDGAADADHRYSDGERIGRFTAVHLPGHKPDNHALIDEDAKIAVMGDGLSGADQRGLPAGYFHLPPAVYSHDLNQAEERLGRLLAYDFEVGLVFHGSSVLKDARETLEAYVDFPGKP